MPAGADAPAGVTVPGRRVVGMGRCAHNLTARGRPEPRVELLWFRDCPNHPAARTLLHELVDEIAPGVVIHEIDASDPEVAARERFPGSPTIRIGGRDVDPSFADPGDYTPRCRLYRTAGGLRGVPERAWVEAAIRAEVGRGRHRSS